jgi:hypothetical protein
MRVCALSVLMLGYSFLGIGEPHITAQEKRPKAVKISEQVEKDLGEKTIAILSGATKVEVFRLEKQFVQKATPKTIGSDKMLWTITATGKEKDKEFAAKVRALLFDETTRTSSGVSGCRGDVAFRLWKEKESVTIIVDFDGFQFLVVARDAKGKELHVAWGGFLFNAKGEFDEGELFNRVKSLALEAFPDDKQLKALKKVEIDFVDPLKPPKK